MQLQVKGKGISVTDALFDHAEQKLEKLVRIFPPWDEATSVELELSVERNPKIERAQIAEVTVRTKGPVLRVRESADDMYVAIDQAAHKLERQARKLPRPPQGPPRVRPSTRWPELVASSWSPAARRRCPRRSSPRASRSSHAPAGQEQELRDDADGRRGRGALRWTCSTTTSTSSATTRTARSTWSTGVATATSA